MATVRAWPWAKTAVTVFALSIVTVQWRPLTPPESQCFQAMKSEPGEGVAVSVTLVPCGKLSSQKGVQLIRPGELVMRAWAFGCDFEGLGG